MQRINISIAIILMVVSLQCISCNGRTKSLKQQFLLLTYGLPDFDRQNSTNVVADKWGIRFRTVAGCIVTQELENMVEEQNRSVEPLIAKKYGKDWKDKFYKEVEAEFEIEKKVTALVDSISYIKQKQTDMEKQGNGLHYIMSPDADADRYNVWVQGWGEWKGKDKWVTYYTFLVDYQTKSVNLLSDKVTME
ncbi:MAG: hypothetical protein ABI480_15080 [Chitinophagaceae bacterium]